jgi:hypothetical protein
LKLINGYLLNGAQQRSGQMKEGCAIFEKANSMLPLNAFGKQA